MTYVFIGLIACAILLIFYLFGEDFAIIAAIILIVVYFVRLNADDEKAKEIEEYEKNAISANSMEAVTTWNWNLRYDDYSVEFYGDQVIITTPRPKFTVNIIYNDGNGNVDWGYNIGDIDQKVYNELNSLSNSFWQIFSTKKEDYQVKLRYKGVDKNGITRYTKSWRIGILSINDVKKYQNAQYFHSVSDMIINDLNNQR